MRSPSFFVIWNLIFGLFLAGCGYQNISQRPSFDLYFPILTNRTGEPGVEVILTSALTRELLRRGVSLSPEERASHFLSGAVTSYQRSPLAFQSEDPAEVKIYRLVVTVHLDLSACGERLKETDLSSARDYYLVGPFARSESETLQLLADDLAKRAWLLQERR